MIDLLLGILATWRLTSLLYKEDGPFEVFARFRDWAGVRYNEFSEPVSDTQVGKMLSCFWCASVWGALVIGILQGKRSVVDILAYSTGAIFLRDIQGKLK